MKVLRDESRMVEIVLVRHGEPDWEPDGLGVDNPRLTERGRIQAEATARRLAGERFDSFYVSPLRRARETAEPIAQALGNEPQVESWIQELAIPSLTGQTSAEIRRAFEGLRARDLQRWWEGVPGGETLRHFQERVFAGVEGLLVGDHRLRLHSEQAYRLWRIPDEGQRILIVAHEGTNALILTCLLGIEPVPWGVMRFSMDFAGITRIHTTPAAGGHVWVLSEFNSRHHLDSVGKT